MMERASTDAPAKQRESRLVAVVAETMDSGKLQTVGDACTRARARVCFWKPGLELAERPSVVVAALDAGARQIPETIIDIADRRFPGTQVLLLCDERLVRPTVTLQHGRLTLVEPPVTTSRLVSRLRLLLVGEPTEKDSLSTRSPLLHPGSGSFQCREYRQAHWWAAEFACGGNEPDPVMPPSPWLGLDQGLTAVLAPYGSQVPPDEIERAVAIVRHGTDRGDRASALERVLGPNTGLMHLTSDAQNWIIYWPCHDRPLWLFSPLRLPRWSDLALSSPSNFWQVPARAGDIIAALSSRTLFGGALSPASFLPSIEVSSAMLDGGPALLELLEARLSTSPKPFSCVLAEVR